jgi:predicted transcriptional regulator
MGLGSTAKKVQQLGDLAEKLYKMVNEVLERLGDLQDRVEQSTEDVRAVRREQREQRAILEALAAEQGVDVDAVVAEADVELPEDGEGGADGPDDDAPADDADAATAADQ